VRISKPALKTKGDRTRVTATIVWEDSDRPAHELYFETTLPFAKGVSCNPHAFLTACIMPAMRHGEKRIAMDAEICPELRTGLRTAMGWIFHWFGGAHHVVSIEAKVRASLPEPRTPARAGVFLSGGIDSLSTLRANRLDFPLEHPGSFRDGLLIHGIEKGKTPQQFQQAFAAVSNIAQDAGIDVIPVYTNIRDLDDDSAFWGHEFQGAALSAVAHAFSRRLTAISIPATYDLRGLIPYGSHPLLDPQYSSADLQIRHDGVLLSRLDKTKLIADWDLALQNIRVCNRPKAITHGALNCGVCEKCLRTKLALLALGKLEQAGAFPASAPSISQLLSTVTIGNTAARQYQESCYQDAANGLAESGHIDLARQVEQLLARSHARRQQDSNQYSLQNIRKRFFKGGLTWLRRAMGQKT